MNLAWAKSEHTKKEELVPQSWLEIEGAMWEGADFSAFPLTRANPQTQVVKQVSFCRVALASISDCFFSVLCRKASLRRSWCSSLKAGRGRVLVTNLPGNRQCSLGRPSPKTIYANPNGKPNSKLKLKCHGEELIWTHESRHLSKSALITKEPKSLKDIYIQPLEHAIKGKQSWVHHKPLGLPLRWPHEDPNQLRDHGLRFGRGRLRLGSVWLGVF